VRAGGWDATRILLLQLVQFGQKTQNDIAFRAETKEFSLILIFQNNGLTQKHPFQ
jgi:hypothetical protein